MNASIGNVILRGCIAAICCLAAVAAQAECVSVSDILRAEEAAQAFALAPDDPAARGRLQARLDVLAALHPDAEGHGQTTIGLFIATRRMLPVVSDAAGAEAAQAYAADPAFRRPLEILTAPGTQESCGATGVQPPDPERAMPVETKAAEPPKPQRAAALASLPYDLEDLATPDLRYLLGLVLLIGAALLAPLGRRERRFVVYHPARICTERGEEDAHVLDISRSGAKLRMNGGLTNGQIVDLRIAGSAHWAEVRWTKDDMFGVLFRDRLTRAEFREFLRQAREGAGVALSDEAHVTARAARRRLGEPAVTSPAVSA